LQDIEDSLCEKVLQGHLGTGRGKYLINLLHLSQATLVSFSTWEGLDDKYMHLIPYLLLSANMVWHTLGEIRDNGSIDFVFRHCNAQWGSYG